MSTRAVVQGSFTLKRTYPVPPARLFRAWSDQRELSQWAAPADGWTHATETFDFSIGGVEVSRFGPANEEPYVVNSRFDDIVPNERIVTAFSISKGEARISSTVMCVEFLPVAGGTELVLTESGLFLDGQETPAMRETGTRFQLDQLATYLGRQAT